MRKRQVLLMVSIAGLLLTACGEKKEPRATADLACWRVYATNEISGDLTVVAEPAHKLVATVKVGKRPRGMAVHGSTLYIALSGWPIAGPGVDENSLPPPDKNSDAIAIFDTKSLKVTRLIRGVSNPEQLAISPDGTTLYAADEDAGAVHVIGTDGVGHGSIPTGAEPEGTAISPDGALLLVGSEGGGQITVIDTANGKPLTSVPVGERPRGIIFSHDGRRAFVTNELGAEMVTLDVAARSVIAKTKIPGKDSKPMGLAMAKDDSAVFVSTGRGGMLVRVPLDGGDQKSVPVGQRPWGIAASPDGRFIYTANGPSNDISVVNAANMAVETKLGAGERPWGVVVGPSPGKCATRNANGIQ
ncbi:MAG TPA: beta-propeller fold lactonase family protein [Rhizomicrobium sp.]|jgi:YVTN family beta-propeller protein